MLPSLSALRHGEALQCKALNGKREASRRAVRVWWAAVAPFTQRVTRGTQAAAPSVCGGGGCAFRSKSNKGDTSRRICARQKKKPHAARRGACGVWGYALQYGARGGTFCAFAFMRWRYVFTLPRDMPIFWAIVSREKPRKR